jgi:hypothetical protein
MREAGEDDVFELATLLGNRGGNPGIRVAMKIHPPGGDGINDLSAVRGVEHCSFGFRDMQRRRIEDGVREWVPDLQRRAHCAKAERSK